MNQTPKTEYSVMLVDDHAIWREGVRTLLEDTEFTVVGEAESGVAALEVARRTRPRLTLLDIRMAGGDGLEALVDLKREHPRMAVVMLTIYENPAFVSRAIAGGAAGYLLKGMERAEILDALRAVANGEMLLSPHELIHYLRGIADTGMIADDLIHPLTQREMEILRLLATGLSNRSIGARLYISEGTVKSHVVHIFHKLCLSDRVQAAVWAVRHGLVPLPA